MEDLQEDGKLKPQNPVGKNKKVWGKKRTHDTEMSSDLYNHFSSQGRQCIQERPVH